MKGETYDIGAVLDKLGNSGKLTTRDKRWISAQINKEHERHVELKLMDVFARDPEFKYYLGMAAGAGVAIVGTMIKGLETQPESTTVDDALSYSWLLSGGAIAAVTGSPILAALTWGDSSDGLAGQIGNILALGGTGFAGTCAMILILKAIFTGTDLGELLSGVGEIMPL